MVHKKGPKTNIHKNDEEDMRATIKRVCNEMTTQKIESIYNAAVW